MAEGSRLCIRALHAGYGGQAVLRGASLALEAGEIAALLGLNGSGKSTLLRASLGLTPCTGGSVTVDGEDLLRASPRRRAQLCAYIPQRSRMDEGVTALETVLMGANARTPLLGGYSASQRRRALACLARLGGEGWAERTMGSLSQGQRQLVLLARAMMQEPGVLVLDEPDSALDLPNRRGMMACVRAMADGGCAALIAMHDASLALNACDRVLILHGGRIGAVLDMRTADEAEVCGGVRLLYGEAHAERTAAGWAVLP